MPEKPTRPLTTATNAAQRLQAMMAKEAAEKEEADQTAEVSKYVSNEVATLSSAAAPDNERMVRLSVDVVQSLHKRIKRYCLDNDIPSTRAFMVTAAEDYLKGKGA